MTINKEKCNSDTIQILKLLMDLSKPLPGTQKPAVQVQSRDKE